MEVCLFEPEIAQNTGTIARLCACFGLRLNIIEPMSFIFDSREFKRAGMDYVKKTDIIFHNNFQDFRNSFSGRIILLDTKAETPYFDLRYKPSDCIMVGKESSGVPEDVYDLCDEKVVIPMVLDARSLNVAISLAIGVSEAIRQLRYLSC